MSRKLIASVVAASLAFTSVSAAPAQADTNRDLARFLFGAATVIIIGKAISDANKRKQETTRMEVYTPPRHRYEERHRYEHKHKHKHKRKYQRTVYPPLPAWCMRAVETRNGGVVRFYGQRCLQRNYSRASSLPISCRQTVRTPRGWREGYNARCLRGHGFRMAGR